jgi:hypothetical protein
MSVLTKQLRSIRFCTSARMDFSSETDVRVAELGGQTSEDVFCDDASEVILLSARLLC